jgi:hypothetical protein
MKRLHSLGASVTLCAVVVGTLVVPSARAQGSDSCATPTVLGAGTTFPFNNGAATQGAEGQSYSQCLDFGSTTINHDVWFTWTSPGAGTFTLSTCGLTGVDTKIAVYDGSGCPAAPPLACNDDSCNFQSSVVFTAVTGNVYTFQLGTFPSASGGTGSFGIVPGGTATSCPESTGPDVVVGDVSDVGNHPAAAGLDAISLGTTSCNVGTATVSWQASTPAHPVIGGALYRYRVENGSGRFEQLGQSWLKHGFTALSGSLCCPCQGGGGSVLGVGCSDPYGSGLNGSQPGLGPRWQVNAHTGVFTYPPANPPYSGNTARRLEFALADIDTSPGVRYLGECMYITADDAAAGNQNNNASCREMTVTGGADANFTILGATQRERLAIRNWPTYEPGATLTDVQVPGDGHFVVGSKATSLGGGVWHYEFAVCNQNADRCGGTFRVPLPAGANVQNVGFHDVAYRNGDGPGNVNFSGLDWTASTQSDGITWSTETQAQNGSANALRWGTTYNFRFDVDVAPTTGNVQIGLWKPGTPSSMNATAQVPAGGNRNIAAFCAGDGSASACPCTNEADPGSGTGCKNSLGHGALLGTSGNPSVSNDSLALLGSGMPNASALYFQGTQSVNGSLGAAFGDGLRCVGGFNVRLGTKTNAGGSSMYPNTGDPSVSVRGSCAAGNVRFYQCWYRNPATFCTAETFNLSNGIQVTWLP